MAATRARRLLSSRGWRCGDDQWADLICSKADSCMAGNELRKLIRIASVNLANQAWEKIPAIFEAANLDRQSIPYP